MRQEAPATRVEGAWQQQSCLIPCASPTGTRAEGVAWLVIGTLKLLPPAACTPAPLPPLATPAASTSCHHAAAAHKTPPLACSAPAIAANSHAPATPSPCHSILLPACRFCLFPQCRCCPHNMPPCIRCPPPHLAIAVDSRAPAAPSSCPPVASASGHNAAAAVKTCPCPLACAAPVLTSPLPLLLPARLPLLPLPITSLLITQHAPLHALSHVLTSPSLPTVAPLPLAASAAAAPALATLLKDDLREGEDGLDGLGASPLPGSPFNPRLRRWLLLGCCDGCCGCCCCCCEPCCRGCCTPPGPAPSPEPLGASAPAPRLPLALPPSFPVASAPRKPPSLLGLLLEVGVSWRWLWGVGKSVGWKNTTLPNLNATIAPYCITCCGTGGRGSHGIEEVGTQGSEEAV